MSLCINCRCLLRRTLRPRQQKLSTSSKPSPAEMLSRPTWSVRSLRQPSTTTAAPEKITSSQLHHLLRLAALPLPQTPSEEDTMLCTLQDQLHFVRAVQSVDTTGVQPLRAIQDETDEARRENTITLSDMKELLDAEEQVGHYQRPRRVRARIDDENGEKWDVVGTACRRAGKYFVVESKKE
ncbi:hypothetical protein ED733_005753 [Metarhizium rileyi]|uniref:Glutamyl-tRNA amidotransferase complex subunit Gta3 domain-containing protein n=1 Tax=Metarhizium rileyi (strain RCEF 4871) TaxID=1649241 RepID=A0A5C6GME8_METRR|nr:hypothetical protein ED733_005753 [Metarhizium rileyi]